jgi:hypothetical protein
MAKESSHLPLSEAKPITPSANRQLNRTMDSWSGCWADWMVVPADIAHWLLGRFNFSGGNRVRNGT